MTYGRDASDPLDATYDCAIDAPGGIPGTARALGMSASTLRQQLERRTTTHELQLRTFRRLLRYFREVRLPNWSRALHALCWELDHICIPVPDTVAGSCMELSQGVVKIAEEVGDIARETGKALADGRITSKEAERLDREIEQLMSVLASFRHSIRASVDDGGGAGE